MALDSDLLRPIGFMLLGIAILIFVTHPIFALIGWVMLIYGAGQFVFLQTLDKNGRIRK